MKGFVVNHVDNFVTIQLEGTNYIFTQAEPVNIESRKNDHLDEIRALYRLLLAYVFQSEEWQKLPRALLNHVSTGDTLEAKCEKLHVYVRWVTDYTTLITNRRLFPEKVVKSTARGSSTQQQLGELFENVRNFFMDLGIDLEEFDRTHERARNEAGKFF